MLAAIRRIESRGALETAHRALANCGQVLRYAIATGRAQRNTAADLRGALPPAKEKHHASITDPKAIGELLRDIDGYQGAFITRCAMRLAPLVFLRPGELRKAEWTEIDMDKAEWRIPAARMKMNAVHIVPLASQAVAIDVVNLFSSCASCFQPSPHFVQVPLSPLVPDQNPTRFSAFG